MYFNYGPYVCGRMNQKAAAGGWMEDLDGVTWTKDCGW